VCWRPWMRAPRSPVRAPSKIAVPPRALRAGSRHDQNGSLSRGGFARMATAGTASGPDALLRRVRTAVALSAPQARPADSARSVGVSMSAVSVRRLSGSGRIAGVPGAVASQGILLLQPVPPAWLGVGPGKITCTTLGNWWMCWRPGCSEEGAAATEPSVLTLARVRGEAIMQTRGRSEFCQPGPNRAREGRGRSGRSRRRG